MTTDDANAFLMGAGGKSAVFKSHGDQCWGTVVSSALRQQTDFESGDLKAWPDGNPMMQLQVTLQTEEQDDEDDDGLRNLYIRGQMQKAVSGAVLKSGERGIANGGLLMVRYVSDDEPRRQGMSGAKQYIAKYEAPSVMPLADGEGEGLPQDEEPEPEETPF